MVERVSALHGHYHHGKHGAVAEPGVVLREVRDLVLHQVACWPDTLDAVAAKAADMAGADNAPTPGHASVGKAGVLLRVEPLKWWLIGAQAKPVPVAQGAVLDLSHSRTHIRLSGADAVALLQRHLPIDLREESFPEGAVASTGFHHVGVTLWRSAEGYELFLPRGFALSLWQMLSETALQFGCEVV